jgi:hypothetical protein
VAEKKYLKVEIKNLTNWNSARKVSTTTYTMEE